MTRSTRRIRIYSSRGIPCICNSTLLIFPLFSRHTYPSFNDLRPLYKTSSWYTHVSRFHACSTKNESCRFRFSTIYFFCDWLRFFLDILFFFLGDKVFELDMMMMMMVRRRFTRYLWYYSCCWIGIECLNVKRNGVKMSIYDNTGKNLDGMRPLNAPAVKYQNTLLFNIKYV